jgi:hypothetical protein
MKNMTRVMSVSLEAREFALDAIHDHDLQKALFDVMINEDGAKQKVKETKHAWLSNGITMTCSGTNGTFEVFYGSKLIGTVTEPVPSWALLLLGMEWERKHPPGEGKGV